MKLQVKRASTATIEFFLFLLVLYLVIGLPVWVNFFSGKKMEYPGLLYEPVYNLLSYFFR